MPGTKPLPVVGPALFQRDVKQTPAPKDDPDPGNYRLVSVRLGYHATERTALKSVSDGALGAVE